MEVVNSIIQNKKSLATMKGLKPSGEALRKILTGAPALILCVFLCGHGCKKAQKEPKGTIEKKVEKRDTRTFEEEISEEVEKIPAPAEEWGEEPREPMME